MDMSRDRDDAADFRPGAVPFRLDGGESWWRGAAFNAALIQALTSNSGAVKAGSTMGPVVWAGAPDSCAWTDGRADEGIAF